MKKELNFQLSLSGNFQAINFPIESMAQDHRMVIVTEKDHIDILSGMLSGTAILKKNVFLDKAAAYLKDLGEPFACALHRIDFIYEGIVNPDQLQAETSPFSINSFPVRQEWRRMPENIVNGFILTYELNCPDPSGTLSFDDIMDFLRMIKLSGI